MDVLCLCPVHDLKAEFAEAFRDHAPHLTPVDPGEVADPAAITVAFVHQPEAGALSRYPSLRLICSWGAGVDALMGRDDWPGGAVLNRMTDPGQAEMMAAFAAYYVTGWHRGMFRYPEQQARKHWDIVNWTPNAAFPVGVLGYGRMGTAIGRGLAALGYPVRAWAGRARVEDGIAVAAGAEAFDTLMSECRAVVNVLPLTPETRGILNARTLGLMRSDAILVQLARGAHLVEAELIASLDAGRPGLAALDVFRTEPLPPEDPLWSHPKVMVTPHAGSTTSNTAVVHAIARAVAAVEAGEVPEGAVDMARGY